jgi:hypothetical protein
VEWQLNTEVCERWWHVKEKHKQSDPDHPLNIRVIIIINVEGSEVETVGINGRAEQPQKVQFCELYRRKRS